MEKRCENCKFFTAQDETKGICSVILWVDGKRTVNRFVPLKGKCELYEGLEGNEKK